MAAEETRIRRIVRVTFRLLGILFASIMFDHTSWAQGPYVICSSFSSHGKYVSSPFRAESDPPTTQSLIHLGELFGHYLGDRYQDATARVHADCMTGKGWQTTSDAREAIRTSLESFNRGDPIVETGWTYSPLKQSTHSGTGATEAEALYNAENYPGPFEKTGDGPIGYKTIHSWDNHQCSPRQVTGVHGSNKPQTSYECTVTFSYSDDKSPVAKAALGKGDTQGEAVAAAKSSAQTVLLSNVQWAQPLCSTFSITVKDPYKADYGQLKGTKKERWACEVDFTATTAVR
jgi:hypothetical protein